MQKGRRERMISDERILCLLERELIPALGCTEPIAIAFAAAKARDVLGVLPEQLVVRCSGNIIKNVKSVVVPHTGGMKGISIAALAGAVTGGAEKGLEVLSGLSTQALEQAKELLASGVCKTELLETELPLHLRVLAAAQGEEVLVEVAHHHTYINRVEKNGTLIFSQPLPEEQGEPELAGATVGDIVAFAQRINLDRVRPLLNMQISYNTAISEEGLTQPCGAGIGAGLLRSSEESVRQRARAAAAAGSDARMSGCTLPVVINSGSGNQGLTVCLPVVEYARHWQVEEDTLLRALLISNLTALHLKQGIGRLSAYCGVVSAACGSGAAITWLAGGDQQQVDATIVNALANLSGMICDGAKPSCAAKIASAVDAAVLAHEMAMAGTCFSAGDGIIGADVEETIHNVGVLAREGMRETDQTILSIMMEG